MLILPPPPQFLIEPPAVIRPADFQSQERRLAMLLSTGSLFGTAGGGADPDGVTFVSQGEVTNTGSPSSHTGKSFGAAAADRIMLAFSTYKDGAGGSDYTGATIGGVSATEVTEAAASGALNVGLHAAAVPSGTSGDVDISVSSATGTLDSALMLMRMKGFSATPHAVNQGLTGGTSFSRTINCPAGGVIVAGCYRDSGSSGIDWTNVDELAPDFLWDSNNRSLSIAARVYATTQTGLSITATKTGGGGAISIYMVVASFPHL